MLLEASSVQNKMAPLWAASGGPTHTGDTHTISTHKCRIMQKLEVESVAALVRYAILHKLVKS